MDGEAGWWTTSGNIRLPPLARVMGVGRQQQHIEIQIPYFSITRCDRLSRVGGGVCIYMKKSVNFTTCVNYSNSVCELLILKLHTPSLIVILMYRPPSCTINEFDDVIIKINQFIFSLNSPLPNILILGDFNSPM